jgi:hypothetical protein
MTGLTQTNSVAFSPTEPPPLGGEVDDRSVSSGQENGSPRKLIWGFYIRVDEVLRGMSVKISHILQ